MGLLKEIENSQINEMSLDSVVAGLGSTIGKTKKTLSNLKNVFHNAKKTASQDSVEQNVVSDGSQFDNTRHQKWPSKLLILNDFLGHFVLFEAFFIQRRSTNSDI